LGNIGELENEVKPLRKGISSSVEENGLEPFCGLLLHRRQDMGVNVERKGNARVS
jgi:hypothetical protein